MAWHHRLLGKAAQAVWRITKPRTIGVRAILLDQDDRIALVRHTYTDQWYLPGGGVKKGESTNEAIARELAEEVAITHASIERVLGVYHSRSEGKDDHIIIFVARADLPSGSWLQRGDVIEIEEADWFPLDKVPASTSPATTRRIAEYRTGVSGAGAW
ncbi:NUDIX domain-containing protein [Sphingomonas sp. BK580]|uniref:NUDIX domain-containing protein n=1 Tax=Sphingomonas sp. BK580 TaxID=2586972 RepID=UPI00161C5A3A|nr:NUDIX domain-containing protein [Sphingomonas sp. BK580]MBB3694995.1 ADP-ribose pyrophosphatase YjhB (NUDIX family) [Sphingomonas sp. BK580]